MFSKNNVFVLFCLLNINVFAENIDTGFIEWTQPNGVKFTARLFGDEFESEMITPDEYQIIKDNEDWYYFAELADNGDFKKTKLKIGIDKADIKLKGIKRSETVKEKFNKERIERESKLATGVYNATSSSIQLAVVLIDFTPNRRYYINKGYLTASFENMIFSTNYWNQSNRHPEGEAIFGSMNDYFINQTAGLYSVSGSIINGPHPVYSDWPNWLVLPNSFDYYQNPNNYNQTTILQYFYNQAVQAFDSLSNYTYICFIYGGEKAPPSTNLWPHYSDLSGNKIAYVMSERTNLTFSHIGTHCHEFSHIAFGLYDQYPNWIGGTDPDKYDLMSSGNYNGPNQKGECPSPIAPPHKVWKGWISPTLINLGTTNSQIT
jgi:M6 family metalloprotease-like protein